MTLVHSGTKNMKWGQRNYQYEDGTWTELGKARRRKGNERLTTEEMAKVLKDDKTRQAYEQYLRSERGKRKNFNDLSGKDISGIANNTNNVIQNVNSLLNTLSPDDTLDYASYKKELDSMSDNEIRNIVNRKSLEQQYIRLVDAEKKGYKDRGKDVVKDVLAIAAPVVGITASAASIYKLLI